MRSTAARLALPAAVAIVLVVAIAAGVPPAATAQESEDGRTTFAIELHPHGDARFTVTLRHQLESDEEVQAFEQLQDDHVSGSTSPLTANPYERASAGATEVTGRQMEIRDVSRTASLQNRTGQLAISFTWTNFSQVNGDRLFLGDVFRTPTGTWLPHLTADQELVISFPDRYDVESVSRPLENGTIHVEGPASFEPGQPSAVLTGTPEPWWSELVPAAVGGAVLLVVLALLLLLLRRYRQWLRAIAGSEGESEEAGTGASDAVGNGGETVSDPAEDAAVVDDPLLSDEERVLRLLESEGGRMKQVDIVEATDWSNAKVSQLLSEMDDDGRIDKLRIGRENLISLPGKGPGGG